jgi:succinoglycan biosynthesis protein ExoA
VSNNDKKVSVLVPCRNEAQHIRTCITNVFSFYPPNRGFEVIVIDGMSIDGTREVLSRLKSQFPDLVVIDNPGKTVSRAMNLGIQHAKGEYIVRADARCIHPRSYLCDLIELSERTRADNVGGVLVPISGDTYVEKSIALAYKSRIAMGDALRDRGDFIDETDTVYGGCFKRSRLLEVGMYDESMVRNQDDELSFRLRKLGGKVFQSGKVKVQYFPRKHFKYLFKQFLQYGYWKTYVLRKHPKQASWRHLAPSMLVITLLVLLLLSFNRTALVGLFICSGTYLFVLFMESLRLAYKGNLRLLLGVTTSIATIHFGFGIGLIIGLASNLFSMKPKWLETLSR